MVPAQTLTARAPAAWRGRVTVVSAAVTLVASLFAPAAAAQAGHDEASRSQATQALLTTLALAPESPPAPDDPFVAVVTADRDVRERAYERISAQSRATVAVRVAAEARQRADVADLEAAAAAQIEGRAAHKVLVERRRFSRLT